MPATSPAELYELTTDPDETRDLAEAQPALASELVDALETTLGEPAAKRGRGIDAAEIERLEALGYLEGD